MNPNTHDPDSSAQTGIFVPANEPSRTFVQPGPDSPQPSSTNISPSGERTESGVPQLIIRPRSRLAELPDPSGTLAAEGPNPVVLSSGPSPSVVLQGQEVVPGYEILEELGRGGMGVVYKARHLRLQRVVALKMILSGAHAGDTGLARFRVEAEAVAQLQHPNIVQIYENGEHKGLPFFSLEFVEGGTLWDRMQQDPPSPRTAAELVATLARAIDFAHQRGIVHRDLKPANVLLGSGLAGSTLVGKSSLNLKSRTGRWDSNVVPKIADFGLAKRLNTDSSQTEHGAILGTPSYMAPEQARGENQTLGPAADIYALGAIFYELLAGRPPFKAGNPMDTIRQLLTQDPVPPRRLEPGVPADLETICLKCLEKEPTRRYLTAEALAEDLQRFLNDEPILARPTPAWERAWKWGKRRPTLVALIAVCFFATVGMLSFIVWHNLSLQGQLQQARAEERAARQREQDAVEAEKLSRAEAEGRQLIEGAKIASDAGDWETARLRLATALATIGEEPRLASLKQPAEQLLRKVEGELRARARFEKFVTLREESQFLGTLFTGMDVGANLRATRAAVQDCLAVYSIRVEGDPPEPVRLEVDFPPDPNLRDEQRGEIREDCYHQLLILAETEARAALERPSPEREKSLREALRFLRHALRFGSPGRAWYLRQARYLRLLDDRDGAEHAEREAEASGLDRVVDHFLVGDEFYRRDDLDRAVEQFERVLQRRPQHFWAQYLNALCQLRQRRLGEAKAQFTACLAQRGDFVWLYLQRGFTYGEMGAFEAAEEDFRKALQLPLNDFARYVLFVNRGVLRLRQQKFDEAIADLKTAIESKPKEYQARVNLAYAYTQQKRFDLALEEVNQAIELEPSLSRLYVMRARLHLDRKDSTRARSDFEEAVRREPPGGAALADTQLEWGRLLLREAKFGEALACLDSALAARKDFPVAQRLRAETLFQLGRFQDSVEAFDRYLEKGKPLESVYRGRGLARAELGKYPGAIEDYTRALELKPTSEVLTYRGWAHAVCEAPKLALRDFELAIDLDSKNADALTGRGLLLAAQGKPREAVRDAEEALRHGPKSPRLLYNCARIHAESGERGAARAVELIEEALKLLPADRRSAFWVKMIRDDPAFRSVRSLPRFRQLAAELAPRK